MNIFRISSFRKKYFNVIIVDKIINICIIRLFKKKNVNMEVFEKMFFIRLYIYVIYYCD